MDIPGKLFIFFVTFVLFERSATSVILTFIGFEPQVYNADMFYADTYVSRIPF